MPTSSDSKKSNAGCLTISLICTILSIAISGMVMRNNLAIQQNNLQIMENNRRMQEMQRQRQAMPYL